MVAGEQLTVQVMHLSAKPLRLTTDMTVGYIDPDEAPAYEMSQNELKELDWAQYMRERISTPRSGRSVFTRRMVTGPEGLREETCPTLGG